jgi:hypothetical protein
MLTVLPTSRELLVEVPDDARTELTRDWELLGQHRIKPVGTLYR